MLITTVCEPNRYFTDQCHLADRSLETWNYRRYFSSRTGYLSPQILSTEIFHNGVIGFLRAYRDESMPVGWYRVEASHQPEGMKETDFGKYWVAHFVHVQAGKEGFLDFRFENAGGWKIK